MILDSKISAIRTVLMSDWDPIGCGVPDDEYDSYIPGIYLLIQLQSDVEILAAYLQYVETESIGLRARPEVNHRVSKILLKLWNIDSSNDLEPIA